MSHIPTYKITPKIINLVSKISEAIGGFYTTEELRLHRINRIKTIQGTLGITGNFFSTDKIMTILDRKSVVASINEMEEIRNIFNTYELLDNLNPNSLIDLLKAHLTMESGLIDDAGRFRSDDLVVTSGEEIIYHAPSAEQVPKLMDNLFIWLNSTEEHPLIKSCIFHYKLAFIHPFSKGNGRAGRLWQTLILANWRSIFNDLSIEHMINKHRKKYYNAIASCGGENGCTPFIEFILGIIEETLTVESSTPRSTRHMIKDLISKNSMITRSELASILNISSDGVKYHIQKMTAEGIIVRYGSARGGYWEINEASIENTLQY